MKYKAIFLFISFSNKRVKIQIDVVHRSYAFNTLNQSVFETERRTLHVFC